MKIDESHPLIVLRPEGQGIHEKQSDAAEKPVERRSKPQRQLKDYPQSLQTAARALWG